MSGRGPSEPRAGQRAERARLFVALELPDPVRAALRSWGSALGPEIASELRLVEPEALHATLCFLGWRPVREVEPIADVCEAAVTGPVAGLALGNAIWLGRGRPRVLALELVDASGALIRLQEAIARALVAAEYHEPESRPFRAHVTVARAGRQGRVSRRELEPPAPVTFEGRDVTLFRSWAGLGARRGPGGLRYEALRRTSLPG